jgi:phosphatidylserine synthase
VDLVPLAHDKDRWQALVNTEMNVWVAYSAGKFLSNQEMISFSRWTVPHRTNSFVVHSITLSVYLSVRPSIYLFIHPSLFFPLGA